MTAMFQHFLLFCLYFKIYGCKFSCDDQWYRCKTEKYFSEAGVPKVIKHLFHHIFMLSMSSVLFVSSYLETKPSTTVFLSNLYLLIPKYNAGVSRH